MKKIFFFVNQTFAYGLITGLNHEEENLSENSEHSEITDCYLPQQCW